MKNRKFHVELNHAVGQALGLKTEINDLGIFGFNTQDCRIDGLTYAPSECTHEALNAVAPLGLRLEVSDSRVTAYVAGSTAGVYVDRTAPDSWSRDRAVERAMCIAICQAIVAAKGIVQQNGERK